MSFKQMFSIKQLRSSLVKLRGYARKVRVVAQSMLIKNGAYYVNFPVVHVSLRPEISPVFGQDVAQFGQAVATRWSQDGCGIAAMSCAITSIKRIQQPHFRLPSIAQLAEATQQKGGYLKNVGWIHRALIALAQEYGLCAASFIYESPHAICMELLSNKLAIVSVTLYFKGGRPYVKPDGQESVRAKGGHLVVVKGFEWKDGRCTGFYVDDSQHLTLAENAESSEFVDIERFTASYSNKAIYVWKA
ncbi:MAG: C39 family peptidase [Alphaproteobacteria bacterium]